MNPYDKAHELAAALQKSDVVERLKAAKQCIESDETTLKMVQDFRARQWELQRRELMGEAVSEDERANLQRLMEVVVLNQDARDYLESERQLEVIIWDIQGILGKVTDEALLAQST